MAQTRTTFSETPTSATPLTSIQVPDRTASAPSGPPCVPLEHPGADRRDEGGDRLSVPISSRCFIEARYEQDRVRLLTEIGQSTNVKLSAHG